MDVTGLLVSGVDADGPAAGAGVYVGDVLIAADGDALVEPGALQGRLVESRIGSRRCSCGCCGRRRSTT